MTLSEPEYVSHEHPAERMPAIGSVQNDAVPPEITVSSPPLYAVRDAGVAGAGDEPNLLQDYVISKHAVSRWMQEPIPDLAIPGDTITDPIDLNLYRVIAYNPLDVRMMRFMAIQNRGGRANVHRIGEQAVEAADNSGSAMQRAVRFLRKLRSDPHWHSLLQVEGEKTRVYGIDALPEPLPEGREIPILTPSLEIQRRLPKGYSKKLPRDRQRDERSAYFSSTPLEFIYTPTGVDLRHEGSFLGLDDVHLSVLCTILDFPQGGNLRRLHQWYNQHNEQKLSPQEFMSCLNGIRSLFLSRKIGAWREGYAIEDGGKVFKVGIIFDNPNYEDDDRQ